MIRDDPTDERNEGDGRRERRVGRQRIDAVGPDVQGGPCARHVVMVAPGFGAGRTGVRLAPVIIVRRVARGLRGGRRLDGRDQASVGAEDAQPRQQSKQDGDREMERGAGHYPDCITVRRP